MDAVRLKHVRVIGKALQHERNERHILLSSHLGEQAFKTAGVNRAIIRGNAHARDHYLGPGFTAGRDDANEIPAGIFQRIAAQAVVSPQGDDDDCGLMIVQCR